MHKLLVTLLLGLFGMQAALQGISLEDDFHFLKDNHVFVQFVEAARNEGNAEKAESLREDLLRASGDQERQTVVSIRSATILARLYTELAKPDKNRAEALLNQAQQAWRDLDSRSFFSLILSAEIDSIAYLINPRNLGKGISSNSKINRAFDQYPNQVYAILMKASSLLYAPRIAGGNVEKALSYYLQLLNQSDIQLSLWDTASVYSSIGIIATKRNEWETAFGYLSIAKSMYAFDPELDTYLQRVKERLQ